MVDKLKFYPKLILRTPLLSTVRGTESLDLNKLGSDKVFCEALYLSSPSLYRKFQEYLGASEKDLKLENTLRKYLRRMSFRCTPFGLFASCSVIEWEKETQNLIINNHESWQRRTRFDMHFLCELIQYLNKLPALRSQSIYNVNNTLYRNLDKYRYVEYFIKDGSRSHQITAVTAQPYLDQVLKTASEGATIEVIAQKLVGDEVTLEEATAFVNSTIDAQLLISELDPNVTGQPLLDRINEFVQKNKSEELNGLIEFLSRITKTIQLLDVNKKNDISIYEGLIQEVKELGIEFDESKLLQTDLFRNLPGGKLNHSIQKRIKDAIDVLLRLNGGHSEGVMSTFRNKFFERYEYEEVSLATVLDPECGLGYSSSANYSVMPLVDGISEKGNDESSTLNWSKADTLLARLRQDAIHENKRSIDLGDYEKEIDAIPKKGNPFSAAFYAIFSIPTVEGDKPLIQMEGIGGVSGVPLIGRFADGNSAIGKVVDDLAAFEQTYFNSENTILAEIAHLPEARTGNILFRPSFRKHEIPYLAKSLLPDEQQLEIADLMLSYQDGELVLRSKKLNKKILPRLGNAHNYSYNSLPIYHFLSDLQYQRHRGSLSIRWGDLGSTHIFTPRITYKNVVLDRAQWNFDETMIKRFRANPEAEIERWKTEYNLPNKITLAEGDNELYIDLNDNESLNLLIYELKNSTSVNFKENLFNAKQAIIKNEDGHGQTNEFIAFILNEAQVQVEPKNNQAEKTLCNVQRKYFVGDDWLFFKIYCGAKSADMILAEYINPLATKLINEGIIKKWFFIRYADPNQHLRVRFLLNEQSNLGLVMQQTNHALQPLMQQGLITKMMMDTYVRELERYGEQSIEQAETIFYHDSIATSKFVNLIEGDLGEKYRWQFALLSIDSFLTDFGLNLDQKINLLGNSKKSFEREFNVDKNIRKQINAKYGSHRNEIADLLDRKPSEIFDAFEPVFEFLNERTEKSGSSIEQVKDAYDTTNTQEFYADLLWSYVHMICNRIFIDKPRKHELLIYDFLFKYYMASKMKNKAKKEIKTPELVS